MLLSLPLHVEIWADFETLSVPPAASSLNKKASEILGLTRLNNKASEMLGLRSPRSRLSLRPEDLVCDAISLLLLLLIPVD